MNVVEQQLSDCAIPWNVNPSQVSLDTSHLHLKIHFCIRLNPADDIDPVAAIQVAHVMRGTRVHAAPGAQ